MLRIAICDDDLNFCEELYHILGQWKQKPYGTQICICDNGDDLINLHKKTPFDVIFLDIIMPMLNGMDTAKEIRQQDKNVKLIFLSSSAEFALESYTVKANNYLLKPLVPERIYDCLNDLVNEQLLPLNTIMVRGLYSLHKIPLSDIEYIEAQNKYVVFFLADGSTIKSTMPMHSYSEKLIIDDGFFRCHRSYIVNMNHISTYSTAQIQMHSGRCIPISRSCHKEFQAAYFALVFEEVGEAK